MSKLPPIIKEVVGIEPLKDFYFQPGEPLGVEWTQAGMRVLCPGGINAIFRGELKRWEVAKVEVDGRIVSRYLESLKHEA